MKDCQSIRGQVLLIVHRESFRQGDDLAEGQAEWGDGEDHSHEFVQGDAPRGGLAARLGCQGGVAIGHGELGLLTEGGQAVE